MEDIKKELLKKNKNLEQDLLPGFLSPRTINKLSIDIIEYCINYKIVQQKIISMSNNELDTFTKIIKYAKSLNQDWIPVAANYIRTLDNPNYRSLINSIKDKDLIKEEIITLTFISNNYKNFYNINSYEDLTNFEAIRDKELHKRTNTVDPTILLLSKYGISYDTAHKYYSRYAKDIEHLSSSKVKDILIDIKNIMDGKGTNLFEAVDYNIISNLDSYLRNIFTTIYNESLFKITSSTELITTKEYNGKQIPIYNAGVDFYMSIYSYGLATNYEEPENFYDDWNRPVTRNENFCNSIISSSNIRTKIKHCVFGFSTYEPNDIELLAPNDLGSGGIDRNPDVTNFNNRDKLIANVEFRIPKEIINYTRFTNNEVYRKRRRVVNGQLQKVNPDYIVYFRETKDTNIEEAKVWQESLKAAENFNIPIVIVDCEECIIHNINTIEKKLTEFETSYEYSNILKDIIESIFTLTYGYRNMEKLYNKYLNSEVTMNYLHRIINHIKEMSTNAPNNAISCLDLLLNTLKLEHIKKLASPYWINEFTKGEGLKEPTAIYDYINSIKLDIEQRKLNIHQKKEE